MWAYPEMRLLGDTARCHARYTPDKLALVEGARRISYAALDIHTNQLARQLHASALEPGARVIFFGKNSIDFYIALYGVTKAGLCFTPLNWRLANAELVQVMRDADAHFAIIEEEFLPAWRDLGGLLGALPAHVTIERGGTLDAWYGAEPGAALGLRLREDDPALLLYTSGTTGAPKGVVHTHASFNHSRLSEHLERAFDWRDGDVFLCALPNFHLLCIALSLQCLYNGVAISVQRQFDPGTLLAGIGLERPTLLVMTPTMIQMLLDHPAAAGTDFSSVRMLMYAGSPISLGLIKRAVASMPCGFVQFYGQSETSGPVSLLRPDEHDLNDEAKLKSCGRPLPLIRLRIVDAEGHEVADGTPGELLVSAPSCAAGYWRNEAETEARFRAGWYHTGDIAYRDAEGLYYIYDRLKDMIVTGGENVYPAEVETVISLHPAVSSVAVIGVPDPKWGEALKAIVVPRPGQQVVPAELIEFCRGRLAGYKLPKSVDVIEAMPVTGTGKISKKDLRAPYWAGQARSVA